MGGTASDQGAAGLRGFAPALTTLVGRAEEVARVGVLLEKYRLVTVTGPGGVGKTRLAAEVARRVTGRFADGVYLVGLAAVQDPALVPAAVVAALGVQQAPGVPVAEFLAGVLARQQLLLVLDNCEHLLAAVAELLAEVLPAADDVRVLATSREPVGVGGEARYRLGPLAVPGSKAETGSFAAVTLFTDRAQLADPAFVLDSDTGPLVGQLVARLDGIPLAIELAAARVEVLGLGQLLDRLDDRLALLTSTDRTAAARQRSLAATVNWSYQLLSGEDQVVFRRLAVFPGPFTLDAAETVAGASASPAVLQLVDCSLLTPPLPGPDGRARYLMLETLRAFGLDRLAEIDGERPDAEAALARHALAVAGQASTGLQASSTELQAARWLDAEEANLHQALAWCLGHDPVAGLHLAVAVAPWWMLRGRFADGYAWLRTAAGRGSPGDPAWCAGQIMLGEMAQDTREALNHHSAVLDAVEQQGASRLQVDALDGQAACLLNLRRIPEGEQAAQHALAMARVLGYPAGEMLALVNLAEAARYDGKVQQALEWHRQASQIDPAQVPGRRAHERSQTLIKALTNAGDIAAAQRVCADSLAQSTETGDLAGQIAFRAEAADLALQTGQLTAAGEHLTKAIELALRTGYRFPLPNCLDISGYWCVQTGHWADALTVWAARAAWLDQEGLIDLPHDINRRQESQPKATAVLGLERARAAEERGAAMSLETAAEYAAVLPTLGLTAQETPPELAQLSGRESELVTLVAQGATDAQIAAQLFISISTVRSHLDRIRDKTSCRRRADLTRLALRAGLV